MELLQSRLKKAGKPAFYLINFRSTLRVFKGTLGGAGTDDAGRKTEIAGAAGLLHYGHGFAIRLSIMSIAVPRHGIVPLVNNALVMLGVLEIAFGQHPVAHGRRILGQGLVFFKNLVSSSPNPYFGTVAVKDLRPVVAATATATPVAAIAAPVSAGPPPLGVVSHVFRHLLYGCAVTYIVRDSYTADQPIPKLKY